FAARLARLLAGWPGEHRTAVCPRMQCAHLRAFAAYIRSVNQPHQTHGRACMPRVAVLLDIAREEHILAIRGNVAAIDVASVFAIDERAGFARGVRAPQLCPAVPAVGFLAGRSPREDDLARVGKPIRRATV